MRLITQLEINLNLAMSWSVENKLVRIYWIEKCKLIATSEFSFGDNCGLGKSIYILVHEIQDSKEEACTYVHNVYYTCRWDVFVVGVWIFFCVDSWQLPMMTAIQQFHWVHSSGNQRSVFLLDVTHVLFQLFCTSFFSSFLARYIGTSVALCWWKIVFDFDTYHYHWCMCNVHFPYQRGAFLFVCFWLLRHLFQQKIAHITITTLPRMHICT